MDRPFVEDAALTAVAIGYKNPAATYIADQVLPRQQVTAEKYKWTEYPLSEAFNVPETEVGRRGQVQQLEFGGTEQTSSTKDYGLDSPIPNSDIEAARVAREQKRANFDPEKHAVMQLQDTINNRREVRVANMVFNAANYAADRKVTLSGGSQLSDYVNSDPIGVIKRGMDATLIHRPTDLVLGRAVWSVISSHPKIVNAVKGNVSNQGIISVAQFVELLSGEGIQRVHIGDSWYNAAQPGQNVALQRAWGKHVALLHINPVAMPEAGGITFGWTAQFGGKIAGRIEDPNVGLMGGVRIRSGERVDERIVAKDVGYFIENAVG